MNIMVNDQVVTLDNATTLTMLLRQLAQPTDGIALAVNQVIVPKVRWSTHILAKGDNVLIFQAIAGG